MPYVDIDCGFLEDSCLGWRYLVLGRRSEDKLATVIYIRLLQLNNLLQLQGIAQGNVDLVIVVAL